MRNIILVVALFATNSCWYTTAVAQGTVPTGAPAPSVFNYVEQMPQPPYDLGKYLSENIHYPDSARENNVEGRVILKFVVNEDGHISDCSIVKGISPDCDAEALRVVKNMPAWKPGRQNGKEVKVYYNQPISFKLEDPEPVKDTGKIYSQVEQMPVTGYPLYNYLQENVNYPEEARRKNIEGRVLVKFVVNEDGHISDCSVIKGIGGGCDQEALRVIAAMPPWKPGMLNGKPVKVYFTQPISFRLYSTKGNVR